MERDYKCKCEKVHKIKINDFDIHNPTYTECGWNGYNMPNKRILCECGRTISITAKVEISIYDYIERE